MGDYRLEKGVSLVELIIVVAIALVIAGMAVPSIISSRRNYRANGDAKNIAAEILVAKMRAASYFTQARVYLDISTQTFRIDVWNKTSTQWLVDAPSGTVYLSPGITLGYATVTTAPGGGAIAQAPLCVDDAGTLAQTSSGHAIANTACIVFNSRGIPVDVTGAPTASDAIYVTEGTGVYGTVVSATGLIQTYRTDLSATNWGNPR